MSYHSSPMTDVGTIKANLKGDLGFSAWINFIAVPTAVAVGVNYCPLRTVQVCLFN